jgi:hypothetical protein
MNSSRVSGTWAVLLYGVVDSYRRFGRTCCLCLPTLNLETIGSSKTLVPIYGNTNQRIYFLFFLTLLVYLMLSFFFLDGRQLVVFHEFIIQ